MNLLQFLCVHEWDIINRPIAGMDFIVKRCDCGLNKTEDGQKFTDKQFKKFQQDWYDLNYRAKPFSIETIQR